MKHVKTALKAYLEEAYFRPLAVQKSQGIEGDRMQAVVDDLRTFLEAIPASLEIEDGQYEAVVRWIDEELGYVGSPVQFTRDMEISLLTYINTCSASRHDQTRTERKRGSSIVKKTYTRLYKSHPQDPALRYFLTLYDEHQQETELQCSWNSPVGTPLAFQHLQVNAFYLNILQEAWLMQPLAQLGWEVTPPEFETFLQQLGFVQRAL